MSHEHIKEAFEFFTRTSGLPESEWEAALQGVPPQVREETLSLLRHDRAPHPLVAGFDDPVEWSKAWSPDRIGGYEIVRRIGEGACGVVFEGVEPALGQRVAIKALLPGRLSAAALRRFEREARVLAALDHPGIGRILRVGTAYEGRFAFPYITMELVEGVPLTRFVLQGKLDRTARLELVAKVCDAVQHAHQKGVVHRDLKPSNILVEPSGTPRVLDFGIARLIHDEQSEGVTITGEVLGTPPYLSPEQAHGDWRKIDTRSDIYSLGVLLLEVLTGERPRSQGTPRGGLVPAPIDPPRSLGGDLRAVVLKAAAELPEHRYTNASDMAADLRRVTRREPVLARRAGAWLHIASFARRHKALTAAAVALTLSGSFAGWQTYRAHEQAQTLNDAILCFCQQGGAPFDETKRIEVAKKIRRMDLTGSVEWASVLLNVGDHLVREGGIDIPVSEAVLRKAVETLETVAGPDDPATLHARISLVWALVRGSKAKEGLQIAQDVSERLVKGHQQGRTLYSNVRLANAYCLMQLSRSEDAVQLLRELSAREQPERLHALYLLGNALRKTGHDDEGLACYREVDELLRQTGVQPAIFLSNLRALADCALQSKDGTETALRFLGEAESFAAGRDDLLDEDVVDARMGLARLHWTLGNLDTCERITRAVMASPRFRANSASTLECRNTLGVCLRDQRRWAEAEPILRSVLEERTNKFGPTSPPTANSMINLALTLIQVGRCDEALKLADGAKAIRADLGPSDSPEILECDAVRGACLVAQGRKSEGLSLFDALLHRRGQTASGNWFTDALAVPYVWSLAKAGDTNRAEAFLTQELETARAALGTKHFITIRRQIRLTRFRDHTSPGWTEPSKAL